MRTIFFICCVISFGLTSCGQISDPLRNKIKFPDKVNQVADSVIAMEELLVKLPPGQILSSTTDFEGFLIVNGKRLGLLQSAINDSLTRNDPIFSNFTNSDFSKFISISLFLLRNNIGYSMRDNASGLFVHGYREIVENSYNDMREI